MRWFSRADYGRLMATDKSIHEHITELIAQEHELRAQLGRGDISRDEENAALRAIEVQLDQSWDLLRQRQARRDAGQSPDEASTRSADVVENYLD